MRPGCGSQTLLAAVSRALCKYACSGNLPTPAPVCPSPCLSSQFPLEERSSTQQHRPRLSSSSTHLCDMMRDSSSTVLPRPCNHTMVAHHGLAPAKSCLVAGVGQAASLHINNEHKGWYWSLHNTPALLRPCLTIDDLEADMRQAPTPTISSASTPARHSHTATAAHRQSTHHTPCKHQVCHSEVMRLLHA